MSMIYDALRQAHSGTAMPSSSRLLPAGGIGLSLHTRRAWLLPGAGAALCAGALLLAASARDGENGPRISVSTIAAHSDTTGAAADALVATPVTPAMPVPTNLEASNAGTLEPLSVFAPRRVASETTPTVSPTASPSQTSSFSTAAPPTTGEIGADRRTAGDEQVKEARSDQLEIRVNRAIAAAAEDATGVGGHLAALDRALASKDKEATALHLHALSTQLPASSLTLIRAQAWAAHSLGDYDTAESRYRDILQRMPNDEQSGVNLALLEAARGDREAAQARLRRLVSHNGSSPLIAKAMDQLSGALRP